MVAYIFRVTCAVDDLTHKGWYVHACVFHDFKIFPHVHVIHGAMQVEGNITLLVWIEQDQCYMIISASNDSFSKSIIILMFDHVGLSKDEVLQQ